MFCSRPYVYQTYAKEALSGCSSPQHQSHRDVQRRSWDFHVLNLPANILTHITQKMHYVSHINLYTTYPYILHIHSKSWIHTRLYKYIQYIYILYTLVKLAHLQGPLVALSFQTSPDPCWSDQQRSTSPGSTGWWLWNHPTDGFIFPNFSARYIKRNMKELPPT